MSKICPRHTADAKISMDYTLGITDTSWNFRYACVILLTYIIAPVDLQYGAGSSTNFDLRAGEIKISLLSVE